MKRILEARGPGRSAKTLVCVSPIGKEHDKRDESRSINRRRRFKWRVVSGVLGRKTTSQIELDPARSSSISHERARTRVHSRPLAAIR